jgi:hypothetical protein
VNKIVVSHTDSLSVKGTSGSLPWTKLGHLHVFSSCRGVLRDGRASVCQERPCVQYLILSPRHCAAPILHNRNKNGADDDEEDDDEEDEELEDEEEEDDNGMPPMFQYNSTTSATSCINGPWSLPYDPCPTKVQKASLSHSSHVRSTA